MAVSSTSAGCKLQRQGRLGVWGPMLGQEAAQAGLGLAMQPGDWIFPSYREAIILSMRGLDLTELFAYYRGLYWPADPASSGVFPVQIMIGDQSLHAVGAGMGFAHQHQPRVAIASIGDGATSQGDFLESLNFAGVFKAQAVLFVQNNQWAISVPRARQTLSETLAQKGIAQGVHGRGGRRQRRPGRLRGQPVGDRTRSIGAGTSARRGADLSPGCAHHRR